MSEEDNRIAQAMAVLQQRFDAGDVPQEVARDLMRMTERCLLGSMRSLGSLASAFDRFDARADERERPMTSPWPDFNEQLLGGGLWPGCHLLVSGTGVGKSMWALQFALHAARTQGASVVYAGLELDELQIVARLAAEVDGQLGWSELYTGTGRARDKQSRHRVQRAYEDAVAGLNFYVELGDPMGWPASRMLDCARAARRLKPDSPLLIVLDFLQIVGAEQGVRADLRERIGNAAYIARAIGRELSATVLLVSSVSREHYGKVSGIDAIKAAGLSCSMGNGQVVERHVRGANGLVGLGKESGEIEFSADSLTVMLSLPRQAGPAPVVFATVKQRSGSPGWCSLLFDGHRFVRDPSQGTSVNEALEMHEAQKSKAAKKPTAQREQRETAKGKSGEYE